jgi:hypothetical protein
MNISLAWGRTTEVENSQVYEVWMHNPENNDSQYITNTSGSMMSECVKSLYLSITEYNRCPKIKPQLTAAIDAFMNDDLADDPIIYNEWDEEDIPF